MTSHALADTFESAKNEFLSHFPNGTPADFEEFATINDVYKAVEQIQSAQARTRTTRNLRKIQPFLECLRHYGEVIETFVTVKPDVLALIWGPIKFLLETSGTYIKSYDKLVDVMSQIGYSLPAFEKYTELFRGNQPIQQVLCLFYQDILDLYSTFLEFFERKGWTAFFDALWLKSAGRIRVITENVEKHKILMNDSITLAHIVEAHAARQRAFDEFERQHEFQQRQDMEAVKSSLSPVLYDRDLQRLKACRVVRSGDWLLAQDEYTGWIDTSDKTSRLLWLQGIPGAGKTFLSSSIVEYIARRGDSTVFAFLDYQSRESISALQLLHSFIWQMALDNANLQSALILDHKREYRRINSDVDFVKDLFCQFLDSVPTMFIIIDGLDEIMKIERLQLLRTILEILEIKSNVKVLISSRPEDDISKIISKDAQPLRVHDYNHHDIESYVNSRASSLVSDASLVESGLSQEVSNLMKVVAAKAEGMFLYARLVCDSIDLLGDIDSIKEAIDNLPDGLNEAYDRILSRITASLDVRQRDDARQILALITCCVVPLSKNEIQLAVYTAHGRDPSKGCKGLFLSILDRCGPIIEEIDGHFRFVHFSAREYLLSPQSRHYLTEPTAHACVASMCIKYLHSACFDMDTDDDTLRLYIRSGAFVLLAYVCNQWLHHISKVVKQDFQRLTDDIERLINIRTNRNFVGDAVVSDSQDTECSKPPSSTQEKMKRMLDSAHTFSKKRKRDLSFDDDEDLNCVDPFTFTETESRFRHLLESMLCETIKHQPNCACQELKNIYGGDIHKCGWPGCRSYRVGFDTRSKRAEHTKRHTRPFKCQHSKCPFVTFGFTNEADLDSHLAQAHDQNLRTVSGATQGRINTSADEDLKAILIDAVQENDLSTIRAEADAVQRFKEDLLSSACRGRSSEAMITHLLNGIAPSIFKGAQLTDLMRRNIISASIEHGDPCLLLKLCKTSNNQATFWTDAELRLIMRTRCWDLIEALFINFRNEMFTRPIKRMFRYLIADIIPQEPDMEAEILALECLERIQHHLSGHLKFSLIDLGIGCCSIAIAEFLIARGASIDIGRGNLRPISVAAKQTSQEAAKFMEFLVRKGAQTSLQVKGKALSEFPGPRNIQKWIGITWEELIKQSTLPVEMGPSDARRGLLKD